MKLVTHWEERMSSYTASGVSSLSEKQKGQIKCLFLKTGFISKRLIDLAFEHWEEFTADTMSATGFDYCPPHPNIGYLLKHRDIAISLLVKLKIVEQEDVDDMLELMKHIDYINEINLFK
jgi:hypothetical protein